MRSPKIDPTSPRVRTALQVIGYAATAALAVAVLFGGAAVYDLVEAVRTTQVDRQPVTDATRKAAEDASSAAEAAARGTDRIEDCTTPGRRCFEDGQQRLRGTVASINDYALAAAYCADRPAAQTIVELEACIRIRIARHNPQPQENR